MLVGPGSFERLELVPASMLKIGAAGAGQFAGLSESLARLKERKNKLTGEAEKLKAIANALSGIAYESGYQLIIGAVVAACEARTDLGKATTMLSATTDAEYRALCEKVAALVAELPEEHANKEKAVMRQPRRSRRHGSCMRSESSGRKSTIRNWRRGRRHP